VLGTIWKVYGISLVVDREGLYDRAKHFFLSNFAFARNRLVDSGRDVEACGRKRVGNPASGESPATQRLRPREHLFDAPFLPRADHRPDIEIHLGGADLQRLEPVAQELDEFGPYRSLDENA